MTKAFRKLISLTVCLMMVLGTVAVGGCGLSELLDNFAVNANAEETGYEAGDIIEFGSYPQTKVEDAVLISSLNKLGGDNTTWTSYNYYSGTGDCDDGQMTSSDYMRYKDVIYGTAKYRGVVFDSYRPYCTGDTSSTSYIYQYDNGYSTGTTYWFKYEPIKWKVLDPATGLVLSDAILDSQPYNNYIWYGVGGSSTSKEYYGDEAHTYYANNYAESSIRDWLNDDFCNTAFSDNQQNIIKSTVLDNSAYSTSYSAYDSVSTKDKIYLLSYSDALNSSYGFSTSRDSSPTRTAQGTDYAKCQGLYVYSGNSRWRLRSASYYSYSACGVDYVGDVGDYYGTYLTGYGVRAALNLNLESEIFKSEITLDANNGTGDTAEQTVTKFKSFYPECTFTNKGYVFKGWYIDKDCTEVWTEKDVVNGNMTLYAKWKAHTYGEWVTVKDSTCTEDGFKYRTCSECGFIETSGIDATEHSWNADFTIDKDSTCTAEGSKSIHCSKCEAIKPDSSTVVAKKEHTSVTDVAVAATCTTTGLTEGSHCSVCNTILVAQRVTEKKTHNYGEWVTVKDSTCTNEGFKYRTCSECGFIETSGIDATEHEWEPDYTIDKDSTCTAEGSKSIHCSKCEAIKPDSSTVVAKKEHTSVTDVAVAATCTTTGLTEGSHCSVCNTILVAQQVTEKKTHNYGEWVTVKDSTCTEVGFKMRTCTDCGFIETSNINTSDHEWEDGYTVDKEPTYSEAGSESIHCKHCEAVKDSRSIISISEKFEIEKANVIASLNESGETQDNQYSQNITNEAIQDINNYVYDESKSFEENVKEINAIENVATYKVNTYDNTVNACPFLRFLAKIFETVISFFSKLFG